MSEPFDIDQAPSAASPAPSKPSLWDKAVNNWNTLCKQSLIIARRGETFMQLPLPVAVIATVAFPHLAAVILVLGIVLGYSFSVVNK